jgi:dUTP pyrophosphatase
LDLKVKLEEWARMPTRAHDADAGLDLYTPVDLIVPAQGSTSVNTGVRMEIPKGYFGDVRSKSGLMFRFGITTDGTVDEEYTGNIKVKLFNHSDKDVLFSAGDKIAQIAIVPCLKPELELVEELEETERGEGGFGSTGR